MLVDAFGKNLLNVRKVRLAHCFSVSRAFSGAIARTPALLDAYVGAWGLANPTIVAAFAADPSRRVVSIVWTRAASGSEFP